MVSMSPSMQASLMPVLLLLLLLLPCHVPAARNSRVVRTGQGRIQGMVLVPDGPGLGSVEAFLGVPYASPPVGRLRFMPPVTPQVREHSKDKKYLKSLVFGKVYAKLYTVFVAKLQFCTFSGRYLTAFSVQ